jgi:predicted TIM-barrel fold metal-dependent hydrolase
VGITSVGQDDSPAAVERALIEGGIARAGIITMARKGHLPETRAQNDLVASLVRQHPERYFAFGSVHPDDGPEAAAELERLVTLGVRGLKLHPNTQQFDVASPAVDVVVKKAAALKLVILFDSYSPFDANEIGKFVMLAMKNPEARIILAHMGGPQFLSMEVFAILKLYPSIKTNVWFDLSFVSHMVTGSPSLTEQLRHICRQVGIERVLFASDFPLTTPRQAVAEVRGLGFTADEERRIFHDNAVDLFGVR